MLMIFLPFLSMYTSNACQFYILASLGWPPPHPTHAEAVDRFSKYRHVHYFTTLSLVSFFLFLTLYELVLLDIIEEFPPFIFYLVSEVSGLSLFFKIVLSVALSISSPSSMPLVSPSLYVFLFLFTPASSSFCKHHYQQRHRVSYICVDISSPLSGSVVVVVVILCIELRLPQSSLIDKTVYTNGCSRPIIERRHFFFSINLYIYHWRHATAAIFSLFCLLFKDNLSML